MSLVFGRIIENLKGSSCSTEKVCRIEFFSRTKSYFLGSNRMQSITPKKHLEGQILRKNRKSKTNWRDHTLPRIFSRWSLIRQKLFSKLKQPVTNHKTKTKMFPKILIKNQKFKKIIATHHSSLLFHPEHESVIGSSQNSIRTPSPPNTNEY